MLMQFHLFCLVAAVALDGSQLLAAAFTTRGWVPLSSSCTSLGAHEVDCLVIGSGVSGSTLAFNLVANQNVDKILMVERNDEVGGNLISKENEGIVLSLNVCHSDTMPSQQWRDSNTNTFSLLTLLVNMMMFVKMGLYGKKDPTVFNPHPIFAGLFISLD